MHLFHLFLLVLTLWFFFLVPGFSFFVSHPYLWKCIRAADNSMCISLPSLFTFAPCLIPSHMHIQFWFSPTTLTLLSNERDNADQTISYKSRIISCICRMTEVQPDHWHINIWTNTHKNEKYSLPAIMILTKWREKPKERQEKGIENRTRSGKVQMKTNKEIEWELV